MVDVFGYLKVCVVSGRGFQGSSPGLGRLGNHSYYVQVLCDDHVWQTRAASPTGKSGVVQWGDSKTLRCIQRVPSSLSIVIHAEGILRKKEEVGKSAYDLRQTVAEGQSVATIQLKKGSQSYGEIYIQVAFTSGPPAQKPPVERPTIKTYPSWQPSFNRRHSYSGQVPATSQAVYSPLGCALGQQPDSPPRFQPPGRLPSQLSVPLPPRHLLSRQACRTPEHSPDDHHQSGSREHGGEGRRLIDGHAAINSQNSSPNSPSVVSQGQKSTTPQQPPAAQRESLLASLGAWMRPSLRSPAAAQQTAPESHSQCAAGFVDSTIGDKSDPLRQKTRLEEELLQAVDPDDCKPSAPPLDFTILALR